MAEGRKVLQASQNETDSSVPSSKDVRKKLQGETVIPSKKLALGLHTRTQRAEAGSDAGAETQSAWPTSHDTHMDAHTHTRVHTHTHSHTPAAPGHSEKKQN